MCRKIGPNFFSPPPPSFLAPSKDDPAESAAVPSTVGDHLPPERPSMREPFRGIMRLKSKLHGPATPTKMPCWQSSKLWVDWRCIRIKARQVAPYYVVVSLASGAPKF